MAYTALPTVSTDDEWTATQHNTYIKDNFAWLAQLGVELKVTDSIPPVSDVTSAPVSVVESSGAAPNPAWYVIALDDAADEGRQWNFKLPRFYGSAPVLKINYYMAGANTSKNVRLVCQVAAISDGDASATAKVFATANGATIAVPDAAGTEDVASITLTNADSMTAGDRVMLLLYRDADHGNDDAAGDMIITGVELQFSA